MKAVKKISLLCVIRTRGRICPGRYNYTIEYHNLYTIFSAIIITCYYMYRYIPLDTCLPPLPLPNQGSSYKWPEAWPKRLNSKPVSLSNEADAEELFHEDTKHWSALVSDVYLQGFTMNWSKVRNVMDMNAGYGGYNIKTSLINHLDIPIYLIDTFYLHTKIT